MKIFDPNNIQNFIASADNDNTAKVYKHVFKSMDENIANEFDTKENWSEVEDLIIRLKPNSPKHIITICHILGVYAKWLTTQGVSEAEDLFAVIQTVDKTMVWKKAKPNAKKKYISYAQYNEIIREIELYEEYNPLYYTTLFRCVYEGIYCDDMSIIKNMRASDISGNIVTLHDDEGYSYKYNISDKLANDLRQLAEIDIWERPNRYGICKVHMRGLFNDSVFKIEHRSTASDESMKFAYYSKLRKISAEYVGYQLLPQSLFVSGVMHRIRLALQKQNIGLKEAFSEHSRNRMAHSIISVELLRAGKSIEVGNFREMVKGHIEVFDEELG